MRQILCTLLSLCFVFALQAQDCQELFISEYVEGSGNEKYVEVYNPTGAAVDLSNYQLRLYSNGNASATTTTSLSGTLASGEVIVYRNSSATLYPSATVASAINFNGDDAVALYNTSTMMFADIFGNIGNDPGSQWTGGGNGTANQTLRRNSSVSGGVTTNPGGMGAGAFATLGTEWTNSTNNDVSGLGSHTSDSCPPASNACSELFISEYAEGSGNNKYIEVYNPTMGSVDLSDYQLRLYSNGNASANTTTTLSGTIPAGGVAVFQNSQATVFMGAATNASAVNFNGDDAIELYKISTGMAVDIFGHIGEDPGSQWNVNGNETQNQTLRRNSNVTSGVTTSSPGFPELGTEWTEFNIDDVSGLGMHSADGCGPSCTITNVVATDPVCGNPPNDSDSFFDISFMVSGGSGTYNVLNPDNSISYTTFPGAATDGMIMGPAAATPAGTPGAISTVRVLDANNPSCFAEVTIDVPVCPAMDCPTEAFINEFHYDDSGSDSNEFVEVAISNDFDGNLANLEVVLYNGSNGTTYGSHALNTFTEGVDDGTYVYYFKYISGIQNGAPDGLALVCAESVIEFLSYEGTIDATNGPAVEQTSTDIGVQESSSTPDGSSIQLIDGVWALSCTSTEGAPNSATPYAQCCGFRDVLINEIHYDNGGTDVNEFVEIAVDNSYAGNLSDITVTLYNGSGGASYNTTTLDAATAGSSVGGYTLYYIDYPTNGIQNGGPDGLAVSCVNGVQEFLSYEGAFTATNGPAQGETSEDIGVEESFLQVANGSIQRIEDEVDFWVVTCQNTKGEENQIITECCDIEITNVAATDETCDGAADGTIEITATCTTCDGIEYSIDGVNFFSSGLFTDVAVGSYTITVQDAADNTCQDMSMTTIGTAADTEDPVPACFDTSVDFNGETDLTVSIDDLYDAANSTDNCGPITLLTGDQTVSCGQLGEVVAITVTIEDGAGNIGTCTANITVDGLPCGFMSTNVGCDGDESTDYDTGTSEFTLTSDGCTPAFPYLSDEQALIKTELCGDGYIKAFIESVDGDGVAGIQLRETLAPGAKKVEIGTNRINRLFRAYRAINNYPAFPQELYSVDKYWLKVERTGNIFRAYASVDDVVYIPYLYQTIPMGDCIQAAMYVYSRDGGAVTADFSNVEVVNTSAGLQAENKDVAQSDANDATLGTGTAPTFTPANTAAANIGLTPNPARDIVTLNLGQVIGEEAIIRVFNINGQLMNQFQFDSVEDANQDININALPAGTYYVNVRTTSTQQTLKLIKQ